MVLRIAASNGAVTWGAWGTEQASEASSYPLRMELLTQGTTHIPKKCDASPGHVQHVYKSVICRGRNWKQSLYLSVSEKVKMA